MTKLEMNILGLTAGNIELYGGRHATLEHVWRGRAHLVEKLRKNVPVMRKDAFIQACMFPDVETLIGCTKIMLLEELVSVEKYLTNRHVTWDLELDHTFGKPVAEGIAMGSDWNTMHPASAVKLVIQKDAYTSFRIVTVTRTQVFRIWTNGMMQ